jgi:uncharacterized protein YndB with AHSA1/START domain
LSLEDVLVDAIDLLRPSQRRSLDVAARCRKTPDMVSGNFTVDDPNEIVSERLFDAPRQRVFEAFSDPGQLVRWWGPKGFTSTFHEFDLREGGAWRFVMRGSDGTEYQMTKGFVEVAPPTRIVLRHVQAEHTFTMTMTFVEQRDRTRLTWRMRFDSKDEAERVRRPVMEANEQNFDRLAEHLAMMDR